MCCHMYCQLYEITIQNNILVYYQEMIKIKMRKMKKITYTQTCKKYIT